ncbi:MAG: di-trans,poly-cis-decaprenylcistransferase [Candidatus Pacebacteria bacterium]|nr:di-trans,poly-cis-decaprenylcistransferase [Candidatus Paceibacterota bacterium]
MPKAIGIIMDGNRRWARSRNLPLLEGHRQGAEKLKDVARWSRDAGVQELTVYAFSTENWKRSEEEVSYLMKLLGQMLSKDLQELHKEHIQLRFVGERDRFQPTLIEKMNELERVVPLETKLTLVIALSYGGRAELTSAVNTLIERGVENVSEEDINRALWTNGLMDPDMVIRTGGEKRLSNFLPWQSVYSELFFSETMWPEFSFEEFLSCIEAFRSRERRRGA